jgi:DNA-binding IclR family transcriptional regulator
VSPHADPGPAPEGASRPNGKGGLRVVDQVAQILYTFGSGGREHGPRELARRLDVSKSTAQRILASLENAGLLTFSERTQRYTVGSGLLSIAAAFTRDDNLLEVARAPLAHLRDVSGETVMLSIPVQASRVTIYQLESPHELRYAARIGHPYPLTSGATGRALLALMDEAKREQTLKLIADDANAAGDGRTVDLDALRTAVAAVAEVGYAESYAEWAPGGNAVAVPIRCKDDLIAAIGLYGPDLRLTRSRIRELLPTLRQAARQIEAAQ